MAILDSIPSFTIIYFTDFSAEIRLSFVNILKEWNLKDLKIEIFFDFLISQLRQITDHRLAWESYAYADILSAVS